jgi:hypothetical protein
MNDERPRRASSPTAVWSARSGGLRRQPHACGGCPSDVGAEVAGLPPKGALDAVRQVGVAAVQNLAEQVCQQVDDVIRDALLWPGDSGFTVLFDDAPDPDEVQGTDDPRISLVHLGCLLEEHPELGRGLDLRASTELLTWTRTTSGSAISADSKTTSRGLPQTGADHDFTFRRLFGTTAVNRK